MKCGPSIEPGATGSGLCPDQLYYVNSLQVHSVTPEILQASGGTSQFFRARADLELSKSSLDKSELFKFMNRAYYEPRYIFPSSPKIVDFKFPFRHL